jgi:hypothetical protein
VSDRQVILSDQVHAWLTQMMQRAMATARSNPARFTTEVAQNIIDVNEALDNAPVVNEDPPPKRKQRTAKEPPIIRQHGCKTHPEYAAKRPPRKDCPGCWESYKFYNPTKYVLARRRWDRAIAAQGND